MTIVQHDINQSIAVDVTPLLVVLFQNQFQMADAKGGCFIVQFRQHRDVPEFGTTFDDDASHNPIDEGNVFVAGIEIFDTFAG